MTDTQKAYADPRHEGNSSKYWTGNPCVEKGCKKNAGTRWSPLWCFDHNVKRIARINASLDDIIAQQKLREMVNAETASLRAYCERLVSQRDRAAAIVWERIDGRKISDRDVLLTMGAGWIVHIGRWQVKRRSENGFTQHAGWKTYGGGMLGEDEVVWFAEIPPAPSEYFEPIEREEVSHG